MKKILIIAFLSTISKAYSQTEAISDSLAVETVSASSTEKHIAISEKILKKKGWINNRNSFYTRGILGFIKGIYSGDKKIFVLTEFRNNTNINYDIESISFLSNPLKNSVKKIEADEKIYVPIYQTEAEVINKKSTTRIVFAFEKFTISDDKNIILIMNELEGERTISLEIKPQYISKAEFIN
ncbi:DUF4138 domain-containing protein [Chryseobacterium balustinum]|uniref:DUF4138 domain-containing protein n=1 Tax=Chryseobacterium balustinum TaxID=246 RepID=A0ABY1LBI2_9FLAO|nr:DUF4138 domain-containing protein [Chryseobacterium balustinum]SKB94209.1 protein of unknown function [Chryseobacterium balustinum]